MVSVSVSELTDRRREAGWNECVDRYCLGVDIVSLQMIAYVARVGVGRFDCCRRVS